MTIIYFYTMLFAIFTAMILKIVIDFRNVIRLSRINKKNKKLDSICIVTQYEGAIDDITNQISSLQMRKNKLITIAVLVRHKIDTKTRKIILSEIRKITKNKIILIDFNNKRGITSAIINNCESKLVVLTSTNQHLSQGFINRIIKISSRYASQPVFVPSTYQKIGYSLGSLLTVRSNLFTKFYQKIFGIKVELKHIQPGFIYQISYLQKNITVRVPIESVCSIRTDFYDSKILDVINNRITYLSKNKRKRLLFGLIWTAVVIAILAYSLNIFFIIAYFVATLYLFIGIISQFGGRKYSLYENICLLTIMPIYVAIVGVEYLLAVLELFQKRISKNYKRN